MANEQIGANGIAIGDVGDCWRAYSGVDVSAPQILDYKSRDGRLTGIKYAIGVEGITGRTRIAWVDYPKTLFELDDVMNDEEVVHILTHCNVCSAFDQIASGADSGVSNSRKLDVAKIHHSPRITPSRVSLGDAVPSAELPKYLTAGIKLGKSLLLRPAGNAAVSFGLSVLADVVSGSVRDPVYRSALQSLSDDLIDDISPEMVNAIKLDAIKIAEAVERDGTNMTSRQFFKKHMLKSSSDIKDELSHNQDSNQRTPSNQMPGYSPRPYQPAGDPHIIHRLFE